MYMHQMRHQAKSLTGFGKISTPGRVVFSQKSLTYSFASGMNGLQIKNTKMCKNLREIL